MNIYKMNKGSLYNTLIDLGLSDKEAGVYLACLTLGPTTVSKVSHMSGIQRTNVYPILEKLEQRGLIKETIEGLKKRYAAEDPNRLEIILEQKRKSLFELMPDFKALYNLEGNESVIKHYQGFEGVRSVYDDLLRPLSMNDFYYAIANVEKWQSIDRAFYLDHIKRRSKINCDTRLLFEDSSVAWERKKLERSNNEHINLVPELNSLDTDLVITPHAFAMFQLYEPLEAIVISNKALVNMHKYLFEVLWKYSQESGKDSS